MQTVADLRLFQLTKIGIQLGQIALFILTTHAHIGIQARGRCQRQDLAAQMVNPARINARGLEIFIHQRLKIAQRPIGFGPCQRWCQVVDDHRLRAPLGLRAFARVIDDERIDVRHRPQNRLWQAAVGQGDRFARQPFQIAVLAHMHDGIRAEIVPQPEIEGEVIVGRHEVG